MRRTLCWTWLLLLVPSTAWAHAEDVWTFDPWVVTPLLLSATMYGLGLVVLWRRAGIGRGVRRWQAACYGAGWLLLAVTLLSPLHLLGVQLFTAHMVEHELIMAVAAPLLALARPIGAFLWALPVPLRPWLGRTGRLRTGWSVVTAPVPATIWHGALIWFWHAPALFDDAVAYVSLHRLQHLSFLVSALAFWWALVWRAEKGAAVLLLFRHHGSHHNPGGASGPGAACPVSGPDSAGAAMASDAAAGSAIGWPGDVGARRCGLRRRCTGVRRAVGSSVE